MSGIFSNWVGGWEYVHDEVRYLVLWHAQFVSGYFGAKVIEIGHNIQKLLQKVYCHVHYGQQVVVGPSCNISCLSYDSVVLMLQQWWWWYRRWRRRRWWCGEWSGNLSVIYVKIIHFVCLAIELGVLVWRADVKGNVLICEHGSTWCINVHVGSEVCSFRICTLSWEWA